MRKVAIVNAGGWGDLSAEKGSYDKICEFFRRTLERARIKERHSGSDFEVPAVEVRVVKSSDDALQWVGREGTIIFVTRGLLQEARKIAESHSRVRVILLTGLIPEGEVVIVSKVWVDGELLQRMVLKN